jgi:hypothetical protein
VGAAAAPTPDPRRHQKDRRVGRPIVVLLAAVVALGACGGDRDRETVSGVTTTTLNPEEISRYMATWQPPPPPGAPATVPGAPDPCTLLTVDEIRDVVAHDVEPPAGGGGECVWRIPGVPPAQGAVSVRVDKFASVLAATEYFGALRAQWPEIVIQEPEVGDSAFWYSIGRGGPGQIQSMVVRSNDYMLRVFAYEPEQAAVLGRLAVSRLH